MDALRILFTTDMGLLSLFTIVVVIAMGGFFHAFIKRKIEEESRSRPS